MAERSKAKAAKSAKKPAKRKGKQKGDYTHRFDLAQVEGLRAIQCTDEEMAAVLGCSVPTIERRKVSDKRFAAAYFNGTLKGKVSLRRTLFKQAEAAGGKGAVTAAIWLSKQYLGMRDVTRAEITGADGKPVEMEFTESPAERIASKLAVLAARTAAGSAGGSKQEGAGGA